MRKTYTYIFEGGQHKVAPLEGEIEMKFEYNPPKELLDALCETLRLHFVHLTFDYEEI